MPRVTEVAETGTGTRERIWTGCVYSRNAGGRDLHLEDSDYGNYRVKGNNGLTCAQPLVELTADMSKIKSTLNALEVDRDTIHAGGNYVGSTRIISWHTFYWWTHARTGA